MSRLLLLGEEFFTYSPYRGAAEFDGESVAKVVINAMASPGAVVLVAEKGGELIGSMMGVMSVLWFNHQTPIATELAWWVDPQHRKGSVGIRLLNTFEDWARQQGAKILVMSEFGDEHNSRVAKLFAHLDMRFVERAHMKVLH